VYRSVALHRLADADLAAIGALGLRTVYDLRTEAERSAEPDRVIGGVEEVVVDVLADSEEAAPADLSGLLSDPKRALELLGGGKVGALFAGAYRAWLTGLGDAGRRAALYHCTTGRDRTGWRRRRCCCCSVSTVSSWSVNTC
jgi:protein-tyrosine phosphatase